MSRFGGIFDARESESETLSNEGNDGNYTYDVYVKSDSPKGHSHDRIDSNGNLLNNYHDCLLSVYMMMEQLDTTYLVIQNHQNHQKIVKYLLLIHMVIIQQNYVMAQQH